MIVGALLGLLLLAFWLRRRRARARVLAGLDGARPVFSVDPPARRVGKRRRELL